MSSIQSLMMAAFIAATSLAGLMILVANRHRSRVQKRLDSLVGESAGHVGAPSMQQMTEAALPHVGVALVPESTEERTRLQTRLTYAGFYSRQAMLVFLGAKLALAAVLFIAGLSPGLLGFIRIPVALLIGTLGAIVAIIVPSFWLDFRGNRRQVALRRALPDALDVLVICLEGGSSVPAGLHRVSTELRNAHPELAAELAIAQREVQMGRSVGEALKQIADRTRVDEIRSVAAVIQQSERFGASLVKSLRVHAETLRIKRLQRAEEMAQKAAVKILFPTILFIFPAILIVILGPPMVEFAKILRGMHR